MGEFYSHLSRKEIVGCISDIFFKCKQGGMSIVSMEYLLNCYQGAGIFKLNNTEVKMGLKDVVFISGLKSFDHARVMMSDHSEINFSWC